MIKVFLLRFNVADDNISIRSTKEDATAVWIDGQTIDELFL